jgi:FtsH-binding integral membrane protein
VNSRDDSKEPAVDASRTSPASLVYWALTGGAFVTVAVLAVVASAGIVAPIPNLPVSVIRIVCFVLLVAGFAVTGMFSGSVSPRQAGQDESGWWEANSNKAVLTWALAEATASVGAVLHMFTGDLIPLVALGGGGLLILLLNRPQRMMEG